MRLSVTARNSYKQTRRIIVRALKLILTTGVVFLVLVGQTAQAHHGKNHTWKAEKARVYPNGVKPYWMPKLYWAIAQCETPPGRWNHNSGTYQGAFGFYYGTWDQYKPPGYPAEAYQASAWQQYVVARNVANDVGFNSWGCYKHGGYRSHM